MKKILSSVISILLLQATTVVALTPPATPGENLWQLVARINEELDVEVEAENSQFEVIESKVDAIDADIHQLNSCCDSSGSLVDAIVSQLETFGSIADHITSVVDVVDTVDLVPLESKIDNVAAATDLSVHDEFVATWTLIAEKELHLSALESAVDAVDAQTFAVVSQIDAVTESVVAEVESQIDVIDSRLESVASCCDTIKNVILPRMESKIDDIASEVDFIANNVSEIDTITLPRIESKIDALDPQISIIDGVATVSESLISVIESKVSALGGGGGGGSPCDATAIMQADFIGSPATYTITIPGSYCLAEDVAGLLVVTATDVTVDLNGHTLTADISTPDGLAVHVDAAAQRVVIRNGRIKGMMGGIFFEMVRLFGRDIIIEDIQMIADIDAVFVGSTAQNCSIKRCDIRSNARIGVIVDGGSNIQVSDSHITCIMGAAMNLRTTANDIIIKNCTMRGGSGGIDVSGTVSDVQIIDSTIFNCTAAVGGIRLVGTSALAPINKVLIKNCVIERNFQAGITAQFVQNLVVEDCVIEANRAASAGTGNGIRLNAVNTVHIIHNQILNNEGIGILVTNTSGASDIGVIEYNSLVNNSSTESNIDIRANVTNYSIEKNDLVHFSTAVINLRFNTTAPSFNTIVANKAHTPDVLGTKNYTSTSTIPVLQWDRSAATLTVVSGGPSLTEWHNWSSVA